MKRSLWFMGLLLATAISHANNIAVIDKSILHNYKIQINSDIQTSRCFSVKDQGPQLRQPSDPFVDLNEYFFYKYVSFCPNKDYSDTSIQQRSIATQRGRSSGFTSYRHFLDDHMSDVIKVALRKTTAKVVPITTAYAESPTLDALHERDKYAQGSRLQVVDSDVDKLLTALNWVLNNHATYNIRVVNISLTRTGEDGDILDFPMKPQFNNCDSQSNDFYHIAIRNKINDLRSSGVLVVAAAGNGNSSSDYVNERLGFPACLGNVTAVFGADYIASPNRIRGHFTAAIAYKGLLASYRQVGWKGNEVRGTSFSSAYVAGQISELMKFNPTKSSNQVLTDIRSTVSRRTFDFDLPNGIRKVITNLPIINFNAAKSRILSDSTYGAYIDMINSGSNSGQYGWNYGTRQHKNGVQVAVTTSSFSSAASASSAVLDTPDQEMLRVASLDGSVAQATSTKTYYRFSLQGYDVDTAGELKVYVNNRFYGYIIPTGNNATGSRQYFYIESSHLSATQTNFIKIIQSNSGETYGITNLQLARQSLSLINASKTGSRITLTGTTNSTAYGFNGAGTYYSQLKSKYYYNKQDGIQLSLRAYDLDQNNELAVYVNNTFLTYITATGNNTYGNRTVNIPHNKLLSGQWNNIDFRKRIRTDHSWVIYNLRVINSGPLVVNMSVGQTINSMYGYLSSTAIPRRRVNVKFSATKDIDLNFEFATRHISANSLVITLNGARVYPDGNKIELKKELLNNGANTLLFTYNGTSLWGVGNFSLKRKVSIVPILQLLLLDDESS